MGGLFVKSYFKFIPYPFIMTFQNKLFIIMDENIRPERKFTLCRYCFVSFFYFLLTRETFYNNSMWIGVVFVNTKKVKNIYFVDDLMTYIAPLT